MANETTPFLSNSTRRRSFSRFGDDVPSSGVRPSGDSITNIPLALEQWHKRSISNQSEVARDILPRRRSGKHRTAKSTGHTGVDVGGGSIQGHQRVRSFMQTVDGSISALTPIEMGRHELYEELPFLAIRGLQKKEHNLSVAFSSYAAALDALETDKYLASTGKPLNAEEKEKRLSQMSVLLLDELKGYNISVMNAPEPFVFPGHSTSAWSMAVAAFCVGGPFGSELAGQWADQRGRRGALLLTTWLFIFGGLVQSMAPSLSVVILARMLIGVASGASTVLVPIYLGELAPPNLRGVIGTLTQFASVIGIFFADLVGFLFANANQWRYMFALTTVMALLQLALAPFLLESP
eukprot:scaffold3895_cov97-Alexandrium_tamarense.AAC.1